MRLYDFIENLIEDVGYVSIYYGTDLIFHGAALDAYKERRGLLAEYWKRKILHIMPAHDSERDIPYITIKLQDNIF